MQRNKTDTSPPNILTVPGWLSHNEGEVLEALAAEVETGEVVEIGSFKGRSTVFLARGCKKREKRVHAIDHFHGSKEMQVGGVNPVEDFATGKGSTYPQFLNTLYAFDLQNSVMAHIGASTDIAAIWGASVGLLFIDGNHDYTSVRDDFRAWAPFVVPGGIVCFHDYNDPNWPDVKRFVDEEVPAESSHVIDSMLVCRI